MNIAIFGASSQIATDLIINLSQNSSYVLTLFSRTSSRLKNMMAPFCSKAKIHYLSYCDFDNQIDFDVIVNFVGVGDPAKAKDMGAKIFSITADYDDRITSYLEKNPSCKYIFLSSGSVYGKSFAQPVNESSAATFNINALDYEDWYSLSKFCAEAKHRSMVDKHIVDVRIFNYFSSNQNTEAKFLMSDISRCIVSKEVLITSSDNIVRDFITPEDLVNLFEAIINSEPCNCAVDAYAAKPIDKLSLLKELKSQFGLEYELVETSVGVNATGFKYNYYSLNRKAEIFGYEPNYTSLEGIVNELDKLLCVAKH